MATQGSPSNILALTTPGVAPGQVTGLVLSAVTGSTITATWNAVTTGTGVVTYQVQWKTAAATVWNNAGPPISSTAGVIVTSGTLSLVLTGLLPGRLFNVQVIARNNVGDGAPSATVSATTTGTVDGTLALPGQVTGVSTATTDSTITVSWAAIATVLPAWVYVVQYRKVGTTTWYTAGRTAGLTMTITGLIATTAKGVSTPNQYQVQVYATNLMGAGVASAVVTATMAALPSVQTLQYRGLNCIQGNLAPAGFSALSAAIPSANTVIIPIVCTGTNATSTNVTLAFADSVYQGWCNNAIAAGFKVILAVSFRLSDGTPWQTFAPTTLANVQTWFTNLQAACVHAAQIGAATPGVIGMWCGIELQPYAAAMGDPGPFTKAHMAQWQSIYNACKIAWPAGIISYVATEASIGLITPASEWCASWDFWDAVVFNINPDIATALTSAAAIQNAFDTQVDTNPNTQAASGNVSLFQALELYARMLGRKVIINACGIAPATGNQVSPETIITTPPPYDYTMGTAWWTAILAELTSRIQVIQGFFAYSGNTSGGTSTNYGDTAGHLDMYGVLGWGAAGLINTTYSTLSGESPDQTTIVAPTTAVITDANFNKWGISAGGQVTLNGVADGTTNSVIELAYVYNPVHTIWQENSSLFWFSKVLPSDTWSAGTSVSPLAPVTPPTTPGESAQDATVTTVGPVLTNSILETWGLSAVPGQVVVNGVIDTTTSGVVVLLYHNRLLYQENLSNDFYYKSVASDVWAGPVGDPRSSVQPPAVAIAAGYNTVVMFEDFLNPSSVSSTPGDAVANFYTRNPYGQASLTSADYTISGSCLQFAKDLSGFGWGFGSTNAPAGSVPISTPSNHVANTGNGRAFQYGYYEFRAAFDRSLLAGDRWWPALWGTGDIFGGNYVELDVVEFTNNPGGLPYSSVHDWVAPNQPYNIRSPIQSDNPDAAFLDFSTPTTFNRYGMLWTPTGVTFYWNGHAGATIPTTVAIPLEHNGAAIGSDIIRSANTSPIQLIIGTGNGIPLLVDSVLVCQ